VVLDCHFGALSFGVPWDFDIQQMFLLHLEVTQQGQQLAGGVFGVLVS